MDVQAEIEALRARVEALEARVRFEDAFAAEDRRAKAAVSVTKGKRAPISERELAVTGCRAMLVPVIAAIPPAKRAEAIADGSPEKALRDMARVLPGIDDDTRAGMIELADDAARYELTWADLGITAQDGAT